MVLASALLFASSLSSAGKTRGAVSVKATPFVLPIEGRKLCLTFAIPSGGVRFWWIVSLMLTPTSVASVSGFQVNTRQ